MTTDDRLDLLVRKALSREAEKAAGRQPTLAQSAQRVAERIGPATDARRPRMVFAPGMGGLNLMTLVLLLVALLALALYVGSLLLVPPPRLEFGFAAPCEIGRFGGLAFDEPGNEIILEYFSEADMVQVYSDGRWVYLVDANPQDRSEQLTLAAIEQRRLSGLGLRLLAERVRETGLPPGRRELTSPQAVGAFTAQTPEGIICVNWAPVASFSTYRIDEELEARLEAFTAGLDAPETWLPPDAWLEPARRRLEPHHFLIQVESRPIETTAGEPLLTPNGVELVDGDPRYALVELPGGAAPLEFGQPLPEGSGPPGTTTRCAVVTLDEALVLARSLDEIDRGAFGLGAGESGDAVYAPDLATTIDFGTQPVYGTDYGCAERAADLAWLTEPMPSPTPLPVVGDAAVQAPCELVPESAIALVGADSTQADRSRLPLGVGANACTVFDSSVPDLDDPSAPADLPPAGWRAIVTLYPRSLPRGAMGDLLESVFGIDPGPTTLGEHPVWVLACTESEPFFPCRDGFVGWADGYALFFEFSAGQQLREGHDETGFDPAAYELIISAEEAELFVRSVLDHVRVSRGAS